jgi:hypothetical protein
MIILKMIFKVIIFIVASPLMFLGMPVIAVGYATEKIDIPFVVEYCAMIMSEIIWIILIIASIGLFIK